MTGKFKNRSEAGSKLAAMLEHLREAEDVIVLALPRGGVPVGYEIGKALNAPLDVIVVRKLGVPSQTELAFGAIASGKVSVFNEPLLSRLGLSRDAMRRVIESESEELERREKVYRGGRDAPDLKGKTVVLVDDGLATGATMKAALDAVSLGNPERIIVAVPVASPEICEEFEGRDRTECVCAVMPEPLYGVGMWYEDFSQTSDEEVCELLERGRVHE